MSGLPKVKINVNTVGLGLTRQTKDGITGFVMSGASVNGKIQEGVSEQLFSLDNAIEKGITKTGLNAYMYKHIAQYYDEAGEGAELWVMVVSQATLMSTMLDKTEPFAKKILDDAKGSIRILGVSRKSEAGVTIANGIDEDVDLAFANAKALMLENVEKYKEASVIIDGKDYNGTVGDLKNYRETDNEYVTVLVGNSDATKNAAIGLYTGRLSAIPVQRNPARVKDGTLPILKAYLTNGKTIEENEASLDALHDKGYTFMRTFIGRAGYFFSHALTTTLASNDLNTIPRFRTIYKARRIAYNEFVENILDEITLSPEGKIAPSIVKSWQAQIDNAINLQMTSKGEISGVRTLIDPNQNVLAADEIAVKLKVQPVGYAGDIIVDLGFVTSLV